MALRFGLAIDEAQWQRLEEALNEIVNQLAHE